MKLEIKNLTKKFNQFTAVDRISYTMENGVYGLLGVNGAGKTKMCIRDSCMISTSKRDA